MFVLVLFGAVIQLHLTLTVLKDAFNLFYDLQFFFIA